MPTTQTASEYLVSGHHGQDTIVHGLGHYGTTLPAPKDTKLIDDAGGGTLHGGGSGGKHKVTKKKCSPSKCPCNKPWDGGSGCGCGDGTSDCFQCTMVNGDLECVCKNGACCCDQGSCGTGGTNAPCGSGGGGKGGKHGKGGKGGKGGGGRGGFNLPQFQAGPSSPTASGGDDSGAASPQNPQGDSGAVIFIGLAIAAGAAWYFLYYKKHHHTEAHA